MKKLTLGAVALLPLTATAAMAQAADYSDLTAAVDFATVQTALIAVGAVMAGIYVVRKGIKFVLSSIR